LRHFLRLFSCCLVIGAALTLSTPAQADQNDTRSALTAPVAMLAESAEILKAEAELRAARAASRPAAPPERLDVEDPFLFELELFAADAMRLARSIDEAGGAEDLPCIFRGMSGDAEAQLQQLESAENAGAQARAYREISRLMGDALTIAPQALEEAAASSGPPSCAAAG
jgi:hypothetical protein